MGKAKKALRVVLDTNILISALIFTGVLSKIVKLWKDGSIVPVLTKEIFHEFRAVLNYPKFSLTKAEINAILEQEILPYFEVVDTDITVKGVCRDPKDDVFISCAVAAHADYIVTGDEDLLVLKEYGQIKIIFASEFLRKF
ncbi:MAG: putative toxin-antitoxin system toxin component, PIN family [Syntrophus sp. (in: bacteria)]|nr:putative toxin-antitoxin system toxin component, PIN family [Syntrophus sp. (in: bacteria)]